MTNTQSRWVIWRWADPRWWIERQIEAAAYVIRMTESVVDATLSSLCGVVGRSVSVPAASVHTPAAETITARVTAPAAAPAPVTLTAPAAARAAANGTGPAPLPPWELPGPHQELAAVKPPPQLEVIKPAPQLEVVKPEVEPEAAQPGPQLEAVPEPEEASPEEATERAGAPLVPGWDELTLGSIRARLRRLSEDDLVALHGYEESHAGRPEVLSMLQNRLTKIRSEDQGS